MNTFNRFIITTLLVLFTSQVFAVRPTITDVKRIGNKTILATIDQPVRLVFNKTAQIRLYSGTTYYLGTHNLVISSPAELVNPVDNYSQQVKITLRDKGFELADASSKTSVTLSLTFRYLENAASELINPYNQNLILAINNNLAITSNNTLSANEGSSPTHTLIANDSAATFSITEDTSRLFSLSGTNNSTLTFNGTNTDYESATKSYTVKIKASTGDGDDKNTEQTITVNLVDLNDETPTAITLTGDRTIAENTITGTELGTLSTTDTDANDTFTYTSSNTKFTIDNNKLKLNTTLDYENATSLNTTITVTDANSHTFDKIFNFTVSDIDDTAPINILLSNVNLIKDQPANTLVGTLSATDVDTNTALTFSVDDTTNFKIVNGNELRTNKSITTALGNTININITASDNTNDSAPQPFTIAITTTYIAAPVIAQFSVTQGENK
ncbi:hypothetical protein THERMOS_541, partial [Bathymodiolus thermophilus thioautotrophic gill symbiont]